MTGKAFEYACAMALYKKYQDHAGVCESPQFFTAEDSYFNLPAEEQDKYTFAAEAGVRIIDRLEPRLNERGPLEISLQPDSAGMAGDVRDVLCAKGDRWEIGLSCKHNHDAVKHSRLSDLIDFGHEWFGKRCSQEYFDRVREVFGPLRELRDATRGTTPALWKDIPDKENNVYIPVLNAFMDELMWLNDDYPGEIPERLIRYLIGRNDFYKVIMNENRGYTEIEAVNINGTLNIPADNHRALISAPILRMPSRFYEVGFKEESSNTILVVCDEGWNVSMRIHNASSRVEPSLKFDVRLIAMPNAMLTQIEPW